MLPGPFEAGQFCLLRRGEPAAGLRPGGELPSEGGHPFTEPGQAMAGPAMRIGGTGPVAVDA